jgi:hypothetical protein
MGWIIDASKHRGRAVFWKKDGSNLYVVETTLPVGWRLRHVDGTKMAWGATREELMALGTALATLEE